MKSKTQVIRENSKYRLLINAVLDRIGYKEYKGIVQDVNNTGAYAGYSGFIYYSETHSFTIRYRKYIIMLLEDTAEQMGQNIEVNIDNVLKVLNDYSNYNYIEPLADYQKQPTI